MTNYLIYSMLVAPFLGGLAILLILGKKSARDQNSTRLAARWATWLSGAYAVSLIWVFGAYAAEVLTGTGVEVPIRIFAGFPSIALDPEAQMPSDSFDFGNALVEVAISGLPQEFVAIRVLSAALATIIVLTLALSAFALARKHLAGAPLLASASKIAWCGTIITLIAACAKSAIDAISLSWANDVFEQRLRSYSLTDESYEIPTQTFDSFALELVELWPFFIVLIFCTFAFVTTLAARFEKETAGLV